MKSIAALLSALFFTLLIQAQEIDTAYGVFLKNYFSFEDSTHNKLIEFENNGFIIGKPNKPGFDSAYSPTQALVTDTLLPYNTNMDASASFKVEGDMNMLLEFKHKFNTDTLHDGGMVEISYDLGETWSNVAINPFSERIHFPWYKTENMYDSTQKLFNGMPGFSGNSGGWVTTKISIVWLIKVFWALDSVKVRFRFISDSIAENKNGWLIDDVKVSYIEMGGGFNELYTNGFKLTPNPSNEYVNIISTQAVLPEKVNVYGIDGRFVNSIKIENNRINVSALQNGIYYLKLDGVLGIAPFKLMIAH